MVTLILAKLYCSVKSSYVCVGGGGIFSPFAC